MSEPDPPHGGQAGERAPGAQRPGPVDEFLPEITEVVNTILGLGAAVTCSMVRAVDPQRLAGTGEGPVDEIVRNAAAAFANVVRLTAESLRASMSPPPPPGRPAPPRADPGLPTVRAGDSLRMPLFIENPSSEPTGPLDFAALESVLLQRDTAGNGATKRTRGAPLALAAVRCTPSPLDIGARDFEKLTVYVDTEPGTSPGRHRVTVGVPGTEFITAVEFEVRAAGDPH